MRHFSPSHSWLLNPNAAATHKSPADRIKLLLVRVQAALASSQLKQRLWKFSSDRIGTWRKLMRAEHLRNRRRRGMSRTDSFKDMPEICWKHWNIFISSDRPTTCCHQEWDSSIWNQAIKANAGIQSLVLLGETLESLCNKTLSYVIVLSKRLSNQM